MHRLNKFPLHRFLSLALTLSVLFSSLNLYTFANDAQQKDLYTEYSERVHTADSRTYTIADGVTYTKEILSDEKYGLQRTYKIKYTKGHDAQIVFARGDKLYRTKSLQTLLEGVETEDSKAVGVINADFYNMSTGVPISAFIENGVLLTLDIGNYCLAIDKDCNAFFDKPEIKVNMKADNKDNLVIIMNKEFVNYSMCLYTDVYSDETKIKDDSTELVLYAYSEKISGQEVFLSALDVKQLPDDFYIEVKSEKKPNELSELSEENTLKQQQNVSQEDKAEISREESESETETETESKSESAQEPEDDAENYAENDAENDTETQVKEQEAQYEIIKQINPIYKAQIDAYALDSGYTKIGENYYVIENAEPRLGKAQNAVVSEVRINTAQAGVHTIPSGAYVLASDNRAFGYELAKYPVGKEVTFEFTGNERFYNVQQAIGTGCIILKDGEYVENTNVSHYSTPQPRSAVGITADGDIVLFAVDGRQNGFSKGMRLVDLAQEMKKAGCVDAANLDGGGSTAIKAYLAFDESIKTQNSPSDSSERRVSNAIVILNNKKPTGEPVYSYFADDEKYVLSSGEITLPEDIYYTDENRYYVSPDKADAESFEYSADNGLLLDGVYYPYGYVGEALVYSTHKDGYENVAYNLISTDTVDEIKVISDVSEMYVGDVADLDASSTRFGFTVHGQDNAYTWTVPEKNGFMFENGMFFSSSVSGEVTIKASVGDTSGEFTIKVKPLPFNDISMHWGKKEICRLYEEGVVIGENTSEGAVFNPDRTYSRNEFCVMLARVMGLTQLPFDNEQEAEQVPEQTQNQESELSNQEQPQDNEPPQEKDNTKAHETYPEAAENASQTDQAQTTKPQMEFEDVESIPEWAYDSVYALYDRGLLHEFAHSGMLFDGQMPVTRREVIAVMGKLCNKAPEDFEVELSDVSKEEPDYEYVKNAVYAGLFQGYEDGTLRVDASLTRAEGAAVFVRLVAYLNALENELQQ